MLRPLTLSVVHLRDFPKGSLRFLDETQACEAVGPGAKFISDALAALDPEFESISSPAVLFPSQHRITSEFI